MKFKLIDEEPDKEDPDDVSRAQIGYVYLTKHPGNDPPGAVTSQVWLHEVVPNYKGPSVYLDFDREGELIGIEIIEESEDQRP